MKATKRKTSRAEKIRQFITANPNMPLKDVAIKFDTTYQIVYMLKRKMEVKVEKSPKVTKEMLQSVVTDLRAKRKAQPKWQTPELLPMPPLPITMEEPKSDPVKHPAHYKAGGIETIDFIEAKGLNYRLGNVVKYITRADHKGNRKQDLEKAMWYLKREIEQVKGA